MAAHGRSPVVSQLWDGGRLVGILFLYRDLGFKALIFHKMRHLEAQWLKT